MDNEIVTIEEIYTDEYNTLQQSIMFNVKLNELSNGLESLSKRAAVNPNLTILKETLYLNSDFEVVKIEKGDIDGCD